MQRRKQCCHPLVSHWVNKFSITGAEHSSESYFWPSTFLGTCKAVQKELWLYLHSSTVRALPRQPFTQLHPITSLLLQTLNNSNRHWRASEVVEVWFHLIPYLKLYAQFWFLCLPSTKPATSMGQSFTCALISTVYLPQHSTVPASHTLLSWTKCSGMKGPIVLQF